MLFTRRSESRPRRARRCTFPSLDAVPSQDNSSSCPWFVTLPSFDRSPFHHHSFELLVGKFSQDRSLIS